VAEARLIIRRWRQYYNEDRPHSSFGYRTPAEFRTAWEKAHAGALPHTPGVYRFLGRLMWLDWLSIPEYHYPGEATALLCIIGTYQPKYSKIVGWKQ
jgi:hypothetical protein